MRGVGRLIDDYRDCHQARAAGVNELDGGLRLASGFDPVIDEHNALFDDEEIASGREEVPIAAVIGIGLPMNGVARKPGSLFSDRGEADSQREGDRHSEGQTTRFDADDDVGFIVPNQRSEAMDDGAERFSRCEHGPGVSVSIDPSKQVQRGLATAGDSCIVFHGFIVSRPAPENGNDARKRSSGCVLFRIWRVGVTGLEPVTSRCEPAL